MTQPHPTVDRLEDQITWYHRKSAYNQRMFKWLKMSSIVAAALIPFSASLQAPAIMTGGLGVAIVILEGLQSLGQYQQNWFTYRSTCEELKHEKFLWLAKAGPYAQTDKPDTLLAERIEGLISREHTRWVSVQERTGKDQLKADR